MAAPGAGSQESEARSAELAAIADELGGLEKEFASLEGKAKRMAALREILRLVCPAAPEKGWTVEGARYVVELGPAGKQRTIDIRKLVRTIGTRAFHRFASCSLKDLEAYCDPETVESVVTTSYAGPRRITTQEKGAAA